MINRETGKTRQSSPMGGTPRPQKNDLVNRKVTEKEKENLIDKVVTAYNSRAMANPSAPLVSNYNSPTDSTMAAWSRGGDRLGFATRTAIPDEKLPDMRWMTRYGAGIDNLPLEGNRDYEVNTPLGTLDYGHEGDTAYAGFTPNLEWTDLGEGDRYARSNFGDATLQAGRWTDAQSGTPNYFAGAFLPGETKYIPDYYGTRNTPFGEIGFETNYENPNYLEATFTPNERTNYYIQALKNLLNR